MTDPTFPEGWAAAFEAAPRELFLPEVMWPFDDGRDLTVSRAEDPAEWLRWATTNVPITTQWDDGHHTGTAPGRQRTSSSSAPSVVSTMFRELSVFDGAKVLEIGTGTGWCAALLSARLGEANVVSVELDRAVADRARKSLAAAGWNPEVVTGDGLLGHPGRAPYDRILVTAGVRDVPRAWIEQTRPGGVIVMPWGTRYTHQEAVVRLTVTEDGGASGPFVGGAGFMPLRSQRTALRVSEYVPGDSWPADTRRSETRVRASSAFPEEPFATAPFVTGLLVPDCVHSYGHDAQGTPAVWLYGLADRSWAAVFFYGDTTHGASQVYQGGPRDLWNEVETAHGWWIERGHPRRERFGLTITPEGHHRPWLDAPTNLLPR
ncbi:methyltransferase domain-containing protein [Streptosporangium saharense]|uniref:Protein-L-isoaspartate O-methyltransferase n=1 Tax=Streptosporangium saharense TaxID=1706840 RepID=A0A7W7VS90_9ACTN|nr:methyltransferase domain-containing protein [Streptosporangium saharense]MBB4920354.1 protein-L-isoaspartate(D-aspartate) O-methyltransferase [Streptosporangium saharense]